MSSAQHPAVPAKLKKSSCLLASISLLSLLAACSGDDPVARGSDPTPKCLPGLISGFDEKVADAPIPRVPMHPEGGESVGEGDGVGEGEGNGIGGADGQYRKVEVTVEMAGGKMFGPVTVDDTKGMVTFVHCGEELPAKVTFEGKDINAVYYDEGLKKDVSFFQERRIGLITATDTNTGVTPLSHALYERAMQIGREQGSAEGWKNLAIVGQAHAELLAVINDQLPGIYRLTDLRRLPIALNSTNDRFGSNTLDDNQNGIYGAILAGLARTGSTTLPDSTAPALDIADILIRDLRDARINLQDADGQLLGEANRIPYTFDTLWTQAAVSTGDTAQDNGVGSLQTGVVPIGYVRRRADPTVMGNVLETEYILGSNGTLITNLNPGFGSGDVRRPANDVEFSQLMHFAADQPVMALRRDGKGVMVFKDAWNGSEFVKVAAPAGKTFVELMDGGSPVVRQSDGTLWRFNGTDGFNLEPTPADVINFTFRPEFAGALKPGDDELGADDNGDDDNGLCIGASRDGKVKLWRPVFAAGDQVIGRVQSVSDVVQVSSNQAISLGMSSDGRLYHLDANHSVRFTNPDGSEATVLDGDETRELIRPQSDPVEIGSAPRICWTRAPYVIGCDGSPYEVQYPVFTDGTGAAKGAGAVTGLRRLPIPTPVWRTRANRGEDLVFIGIDGMVYGVDGKPLTLPPL